MSVSGTRKSVVPSSGGGGAGFPDVASTNQIAITNITGTMFNVPNNGIGTYTKNGPLNPNLDGIYNPYYAFDDISGSAGVGVSGGNWYLFYFDGDSNFEHAFNLSSDPTTIPTTCWVAPITITAA
jgi:hypothetical protein